MKTIRHKFVEHIPEVIEEGILYISVEHYVAIHLCTCGCKNKVVTPISPTDWKLTYDGISVSIYPSIGNWNFNCKSHYWITNNKVEIVFEWSDKEIKLGRKKDKKEKKKYFKTSFWNKIFNLF